VGLVSRVTVSEPRVAPPAGADTGPRADVRITALEAIPFAVPYRRPAGFASGTVTSADNVLVRVHTDAGLVGQAEAQPRPYTYGETQASIVHTVRTTLAELLVGLDPLDTEKVAERSGRITANNVARGAVDLAVWDLVGQVLDRPCHTLLGGYAEDVAAAHMVSFGEPHEMAEDARDIHDRLGVRTFKVKVGRTPAVDVAATRAIRDALPDAELYVDANRGWSYEDALRAGDELIALGVRAIEEPISVDDRAGRRRLAERWSVPLVGDESCISLAHVDRALEEGAVRAVSIKTARTGFTESRRILDLCLARSTPAVVGSQYEGAGGALATVAFAAAFAATAGRPAELTNFLDLADDVVVRPPAIRDGRAAVPDVAGLGIEIDEERLQRYRVDG
jgi:L-alanine-DL-glutamate epimerase-like enolase superfamily enzyme